MTYERRPQRNSNNVILGIILGCLGIGLITTAVVGFYIYKSVRAVQQAIRQPAGPVDPKSIGAQFRGIPLYPSAKLNLKESQEAQKISQVTRAIPLPRAIAPTMAMAAWDVPDGPNTVAQWYERCMVAAGWVLQPQQHRPHSGSAPSVERSFRRRNDTLMVIASGPTPQGTNRLILVRMHLPVAPVARPGGNRTSP